MNKDEDIDKEVARRIVCCKLTDPQAEQLRGMLMTGQYYVRNDCFDKPSEMSEILDRRIEAQANGRLDPEQEKTIFLQLNYYHYQQEKVRERLLRKRLWSRKEVLELLRWDDQQRALKDKLVNWNMGLVMSMARRALYYRLEYEDFVSEGSLALLRAMDRFDCSRGYRFSTYACRAILQSIYRLAKTHLRWRSRFTLAGEMAFDRDNHVAWRRQEQFKEQAEDLGTIVRDNLADLSEAEQFVLQKRFSLNEEDCQPMTLERIGLHLDLSKERVRQIQKKALGKVRQASELCLVSV